MMQSLSQILQPFYFYFYISGLKSLPEDSNPSRLQRFLHAINRVAWVLVVVVIIAFIYRALFVTDTITNRRKYINVLVNFINFSAIFVSMQRSEAILGLLILSQSKQPLSANLRSKLRVRFIALAIPIIIVIFLATAREVAILTIYIKHAITENFNFLKCCQLALVAILGILDDLYQLLVSIFPYVCIAFVVMTNMQLKQKLDVAQKRVRNAKSPLGAHRKFNEAMVTCLQVFETNKSLNAIFSKALFCIFYTQILIISIMIKTMDFGSFQGFYQATFKVLPLASGPTFLVFLTCLYSSHEVNQKVAEVLTSMDKSLINSHKAHLPKEFSLERVNQLIFITTTRHLYSGLNIGGFTDIDGCTILEFLLLSWDVINLINSKH